MIGKFTPKGASVRPAIFSISDYEHLDNEIARLFGSKLVTPDLVRASYHTLRAAITEAGWPSIVALRGKFLFLFDANEAQKAKKTGKPHNIGAILFFLLSLCIYSQEETKQKTIAITQTLGQETLQILSDFQALADVNTDNELRDLDRREKQRLETFEGTEEEKAALQKQFEAEREQVEKEAFESTARKTKWTKNCKQRGKNYR